ncbi:MAG: Glutaredoxin, partial [Solirubrobacteraceae bacterium]|nr:Glutaredoxin [Solirubrobacteraceae bacterium]
MGGMAARIVMYSTDRCSFCSRAKALLQARGLEYEEL